MTDATAEDVEAPPKKSKLPLIIGIVLALAGAAGGFFAVSAGLILGGESTIQPEVGSMSGTMPDIEFVEMAPLVISIDGTSRPRHLMFRAQLEVPEVHVDDVTKLLPRATDVLNSYLRAVDPGDFEDPATLTRLRAQMLRRVQVVMGQGRVNDLLVMEFVLN